MEEILLHKIGISKDYFAKFAYQTRYRNEYVNILFLLSVYNKNFFTLFQKETILLHKKYYAKKNDDPKIQHLLSKATIPVDDTQKVLLLNILKKHQWQQGTNLLIDFGINLWNEGKQVELLSLVDEIYTIFETYFLVNEKEQPNINLCYFLCHLFLVFTKYATTSIPYHSKDSLHKMNFLATKLFEQGLLLLNEFESKNKHIEIVFEIGWVSILLKKEKILFIDINQLYNACKNKIYTIYNKRKRKYAEIKKSKLNQFRFYHKQYHQAYLALMVLKEIK